MYLARSIASNQAYLQLLSRFRNKGVILKWLLIASILDKSYLHLHLYLHLYYI